MKIEEILTAMEDLLEDAWNLPMSGGKRVVDTSEMLELITDLRNSMPEEIRLSNEIINKRDRIILQGREEADLTVQAARAKAEKLVSQEAVYREAQQKAQEIVAQAQLNAKEMKNATVEYCDSILSRTTESLNKSAQAIEETRKSIRKQQA
ncbi:MAG: ATPase [Clostridia bacterium]|nr:ATPase [Clostridia bacterium]